MSTATVTSNPFDVAAPAPLPRKCANPLCGAPLSQSNQDRYCRLCQAKANRRRQAEKDAKAGDPTRGPGRPPGSSILKSGAKPTPAEDGEPSVRIAPDRGYLPEPTPMQGVARVRIDQIPSELEYRTPTGRMGELWKLLCATRPGDALRIENENIKRAGSMMSQLRGKAKRVKRTIDCRRDGAVVYVWFTGVARKDAANG
jgi:hypothetical protein